LEYLRCKLPSQAIVVVHRSDGSGTTWIFTNFLSKISTDWQSKIHSGTSVKWPAGIGGMDPLTGLIDSLRLFLREAAAAPGLVARSGEPSLCCDVPPCGPGKPSSHSPEV
jgi:hypothetical protein